MILIMWIYTFHILLPFRCFSPKPTITQCLHFVQWHIKSLSKSHNSIVNRISYSSVTWLFSYRCMWYAYIQYLPQAMICSQGLLWLSYLPVTTLECVVASCLVYMTVGVGALSALILVIVVPAILHSGNIVGRMRYYFHFMLFTLIMHQ